MLPDFAEITALSHQQSCPQQHLQVNFGLTKAGSVQTLPGNLVCSGWSIFGGKCAGGAAGAEGADLWQMVLQRCSRAG